MTPRGIVIYGAGKVGGRVAALAAARGWPLAGALNRPGPKIGEDLGVLAGLEAPLGVSVSDDPEGLLARVEADIAVVAISDSIRDNMPVYRRLMAVGLNVVCVGSESSYPWAVSHQLASEIDTLAKQHGVTFTGTGFQDVYRVWLAKILCGACTQLRAVSHRSLVDVGRHGAAAARLMRVGLSPEGFRADVVGRPASGPSIYRVFLEHVTASLGLRAKEVEERLEPVVLDEAVDCPPLDLTVEAGACVGTRIAIEIATGEGVSLRAENELRLLGAAEREFLEWRIDGDSPATARVSDLDSGTGTAAAVINRIPQVLAAQPGVVTLDQLGPPLFMPR